MPDPLPLLPTTLVGSYPQPEWLIDREKLAAGSRRACARPTSGASIRRTSKDAQDAATLARDPRPGARGAGHHHRRRDPPRELLQPLRARRSTASTSTTPARCSTATATRCRCRASPDRSAAASRSSSRDVRVPAREHRPQDQGHGPGPVHDGPAGAGRPLRQRARSVAFAFADAVREEVDDLFAAGADIVQLDEPWMESRADAGARVRHRDAAARAGRRARHDRAAHLLRLPAVRARAHQARVPLPARAGGAPVDQISIETAQAELDLEVLEQLEGKTIILGVIALDTDEVETPRRSRSGSGARCRTRRAGARRRARLRHEVPPARGRLREAPVARRRRRGGARRGGRSRPVDGGTGATGCGRAGNARPARAPRVAGFDARGAIRWVTSASRRRTWAA